MNLDELCQRVVKFMQLKELKEFRAKTWAPEEAERKVDRSRPMPSGRPRDLPKSPRFTRYNPLTADRSRILEETLNPDLMMAPKRTTTSPSADQTKNCRYHRNFGHTTEDYWALKDKIEELVQVDHHRRFVQSTQEDRRPRADEGRTQDHHEERCKRDGRERREGRSSRDVAPVRGVINTIAGGFARGGTTSSS